jgi:branched-chain amino acid transport system substrate-binding protein
MRKRIELATASALAALLTAASAHAADKVKIGATATLEGTYTPLGEGGTRGYVLAVKAHKGMAGGKQIDTIVAFTDAIRIRRSALQKN